MRSPDVSVVVPSRDRHDLLPRTLLCAAEQRGVECEVVVVDDGSRPSLAPHVVAPNARVIRHPASRGVAQARNTGLEAAAGTWVAFLDDDDLWAPDRLRTLIEAIASTGADWGFTGGVAIDRAGMTLFEPPTITDPDVFGRAIYRYNAVPFTCSSIVARTELARGIGGFDTGLKHLADWDFALRLSQASPPAAVARPLIAYAMHGGNMQLSEAGLEEELDRFEAKHREAAAAAGERMDRVNWLTWRIRARRLGGDRRGAARLMRRRAVLGRRPTDLVRAAVLLAGGERAMALGRRVTGSMPRERFPWLVDAFNPPADALARVWRDAPG